MSDAYHVTPDPKGGWKVIKEGATRASRHTNTKEEALAAARELSDSQNTRMRVHNKNGQFAPKPAEAKKSNTKKAEKRVADKKKTAMRNDRKKKSAKKRSSSKDSYII